MVHHWVQMDSNNFTVSCKNQLQNSTAEIQTGTCWHQFESCLVQLQLQYLFQQFRWHTNSHILFLPFPLYASLSKFNMRNDVSRHGLLFTFSKTWIAKCTWAKFRITQTHFGRTEVSSPNSYLSNMVNTLSTSVYQKYLNKRQWNSKPKSFFYHDSGEIHWVDLEVQAKQSCILSISTSPILCKVQVYKLKINEFWAILTFLDRMILRRMVFLCGRLGLIVLG